MLRSEQDGLPELVSCSVPAKGCLGCGDITGYLGLGVMPSPKGWVRFTRDEGRCNGILCRFL